ncbi:MAG: glycerol-3-phosphate dehydrogenase/oxidase [Thermoanaerobaculum sp.]
MRERLLAWLAEGVDVLVIGGGITGAGVFHEAALRGLSVGLVEQGDFASGTSSRSSKLIHGGLRYLKRLQLRLTRAACRERDYLALLNPHLVWPLEFLYPAFGDDPTPGWQVALGLSMYDHLTPFRHRHQRLSAAKVRRKAPLLRRERLEFGLVYDDCVADDAQLTWAVVRSGIRAGGVALNYAKVEALVLNTRGLVAGAVVRDRETQKTWRVPALVVVNATGAWCDQTRALLGDVSARLRPSRGSHLLFPRHRLPLEVAVTGLSPDDGRPVFAVPHPEGTLVGTTDVFHHGPLDAPRPSGEEVAYLMRYVHHAFPQARLTLADACGAFAGVRPIVDTEAEEPSEASREEVVWVERGMVSTAGGKLTTFRVTAGEAMEEVLRLLPESRRPQTPELALASAVLPDRVGLEALEHLAALGVGQVVARGLFRRLGAQALPLAMGCPADKLRPLEERFGLSPAEVEYHLRFSRVVHLSDLLLRRVRLGMWDPAGCLELAETMRAVVRRAAGWSVKRWDEELALLGEELGNWAPPPSEGP